MKGLLPMKHTLTFAMKQNLNRREFLSVTSGVAAGLAAGFPAGGAVAADNAGGAVIIVDPSDSVAASAPAKWAADELAKALAQRGISARLYEKLSAAPAGDLRIVAAGAASNDAAGAVLKAAGARVEAVPEALALCQNREAIWAWGQDARGLTYALLELADRVRNSSDARAALAVPKPVSERPANTVRSLSRLFFSNVEDYAWLYDREMWREYLSLLAAQRFNRFSLSFGLGYD